MRSITTGVIGLLLVSALSLAPIDLLAQNDETTTGAKRSPDVAVSEVAVTATRTERPLAAIPESVTVITREQIEQQAVLNRSLPDVLGKLVPGLAPGTQSLSSGAAPFGQTLRGRNVQVLIDGVPITTNRNASRDLQTIDPSAIERIEIVRGATSIYGDGATGGIIHIITKKPTEGKPTFSTQVLANTAPTNPGAGLGGRLVQSVAGKSGNLDYTFTGSFERMGGMFDAHGSRIPPDLLSAQGGLSDLNIYNLYGKVGYDFRHQRLQFFVNEYVLDQHTDYVTDPSVNAFPLKSQQARVRKGLDLAEQSATRNRVLNLDYFHEDLFGSRLHLQGYYRNYFTRFFPFDGRPNTFVMQSRIEAERVGSRLEIETPVPLPHLATPRLLWGADFFREVSSQRAALMDAATFDSSGGLVFRQTGDRVWVPPMVQRNLGLFAQLEWNPMTRWLVRGGVRHERIWLDVDPFTTLAGNTVPRGSLEFNATVFNAGTVVYLTDVVSVFGNYSQGFSIPDVGLTLRIAPAGFAFSSVLLEPIKVTNYEVGLRGDWRRVQSSVAVFYNESELGFTPGGFLAPMVRAPERVYGVEGTLDVQPVDGWRVGGTVTYLEGENDDNRDGDYRALTGFRIPPVKLTGYIEHFTVPRWQWRNRVQVVYVGARDPGLPSSVFGFRPVDSYTVVDFISTAKLGPGMVQFGVENLLNNHYFSTVSQLVRTGRNDSYIAARGMLVSLGYTIRY